MSTSRFDSNDFDKNVDAALRASDLGPVFIVDNDRPTYVLLNFKGYQRLTKARHGIADLLAMPGIEHVELDLPLRTDLGQGADLS